jgi:protein-S-isoprenylcysteine O-methyltransferase Ste14
MTDKNRGNLLVGIQFLLLALLGFAPNQELWATGLLERQLSMLIGVIAIAILVIAGINLGKSLTANPVPLEQATLKTNGLYAVVRHPIYLGLLLLGASIVLQSGSWLHVLVYAALITLLSVKARFEESLLLAKYEDYKQYASRVGRMLPGIGRIR